MEWSTLLTVLPTVLSTALYATMQGTFLHATRPSRPAPLPPVRPWVSVLKPLSGVDDELAENLASFACLDYPAFELLLGAASPDDPAVPVARAFIAAHPAIKARLVITSHASSAVPNPKVAQLIALRRVARGSVIVVSDANVRVSPRYLHRLVAELLVPGTGVVSSLVVGAGERTLGAAIDNAHLGAFIAPAVVLASRWLGHTVTIGKSMAMRATDLDRVGGWESVGAVLAEDDLLARRFDALGYRVGLVLDTVENRNVSASVARTLKRHARWTGMRRSIEPRAYALELALSPALVAAFVFMASPSPVALAAVGASLAIMCLGSYLAIGRLRGRALPLAALEPVRLAVYLAAWVAGGLTRQVRWHEHTFTLGRGSTLTLSSPRKRRLASSPRGHSSAA